MLPWTQNQVLGNGWLDPCRYCWEWTVWIPLWSSVAVKKKRINHNKIKTISTYTMTKKMVLEENAVNPQNNYILWTQLKDSSPLDILCGGQTRIVAISQRWCQYQNSSDESRTPEMMHISPCRSPKKSYASDHGKPPEDSSPRWQRKVTAGWHTGGSRRCLGEARPADGHQGFQGAMESVIDGPMRHWYYIWCFGNAIIHVIVKSAIDKMFPSTD